MGIVFRNNFIFAFIFCSVLCGNVQSENRNDEYIDHRIRWLENSIRTFVYETQPQIATIEKEMQTVKDENLQLKAQIMEQQNTIHDLEWASYDIQSRTLSREERDLVTEMKWTIFDLKNANLELQEEACLKNTECYDWTSWTNCSSECGLGTRIRSRHCDKKGRFSSMCDPEVMQEEECKGSNCKTIRDLPQLDCQDGYDSYQGYCFRFSGRRDARLLSTILCEEEGAHLVSVEDDLKHKMVWDYLNIVAPAHMVDMHEDFSKREFWDFHDIETKTNVAIDGVRKHQLTYFVNFRGETMTYFRWAFGQPRNSQSDGDYCVTLNVLTGDWYMSCCSVTFFYVCESEKRSSGFKIGN